jgi:tetratricopeptide (TPR) repeat protein
MYKKSSADSKAAPVPYNIKIDVMLKMLGVTFILMCLMVLGCATTPDMRLSNDALTYLEKGDYKTAEEKLTEALEINPDNPYALLNMGVTYSNTNRFKEAREMFLKVIDIGDNTRVAASNKDWAMGITLIDLAVENLSIIELEKGNVSMLED